MIVPFLIVDVHFYVPSYTFLDRANSDGSTFDTKLLHATVINRGSTNIQPWPELKKIIDKVHEHVCGHKNLSYIKILLQRNNIWIDKVENHLHRVLKSSIDYVKIYEPNKAWKLPLRSVNRSVNQIIRTYHFHLQDLRIIHIMDACWRYLAGASVPGTVIKAAIEVLDLHCISPFWDPRSIQFDWAFWQQRLQKDFISS